jgi:hypothetical protein
MRRDFKEREALFREVGQNFPALAKLIREAEAGAGIRHGAVIAAAQEAIAGGRKKAEETMAAAAEDGAFRAREAVAAALAAAEDADVFWQRFGAMCDEAEYELKERLRRTQCMWRAAVTCMENADATSPFAWTKAMEFIEQAAQWAAFDNPVHPDLAPPPPPRVFTRNGDAAALAVARLECALACSDTVDKHILQLVKLAEITETVSVPAPRTPVAERYFRDGRPAFAFFACAGWNDFFVSGADFAFNFEAFVQSPVSLREGEWEKRQTALTKKYAADVNAASYAEAAMEKIRRSRS